MNYVIVTPAYNEERFIERVITSVVNQTIKPDVWVIVDDDSTDNTAQIVKSYSSKHEWIIYLKRKKNHSTSYYGSNVHAIKEGIRALNQLDYDYLAILDSDIILCDDYYERIFERFNKYSELGIATGTYVEEIAGKIIKAQIDRMSTPKAIQVFKRSCYEKIGGYLPLEHGGEDSCAEVMARMHGWKTWSFDNIIVEHMRPVGVRNSSALLMARINLGITDYCMGSDPLFMMAKCFRRSIIESPYVLSGFARLLGYFYGYVSSNIKREVPIEVIKYLRQEQRIRLKEMLFRKKLMWRP